MRRAPACAAESPKLRLLGAAPSLRAIIYQDGVRSVSVSIAVCETAGAGATPVELPIFFLWAARLVSKSAGLHPAVRGAKPRRSTISIPCVAQQVEALRRERSQCWCESGRRDQFSKMDSKPQQTGTRLLIGYGEVATTSGSTFLSMPMKTRQ